MSRCMGGWCSMRDKCRYYQPGEPAGERVTFIERLCEPGYTDAFKPRAHEVIRWVR
jgi:hypothetical protein